LAIALLAFPEGLLYGQGDVIFKPVLSQDLDGAATFNGKDRPYIFVDVSDLLPDPATNRPRGQADPLIAKSRDTYEIVQMGSEKTFEPAEVYTLTGGIALFGNYSENVTYAVKILRDIPVSNVETGAHLGHIPGGIAGTVTWTLKGDAGLERQRRLEL